MCVLTVMFIASFYSVWRYKLLAVMLEVSCRGHAYAYTLRNVDIYTQTLNARLIIAGVHKGNFK